MYLTNTERIVEEKGDSPSKHWKIFPGETIFYVNFHCFFIKIIKKTRRTPGIMFDRIIDDSAIII